MDVPLNLEHSFITIYIVYLKSRKNQNIETISD